MARAESRNVFISGLQVKAKSDLNSYSIIALPLNFPYIRNYKAETKAIELPELG